MDSLSKARSLYFGYKKASRYIQKNGISGKNSLLGQYSSTMFGNKQRNPYLCTHNVSYYF